SMSHELVGLSREAGIRDAMGPTAYRRPSLERSARRDSSRYERLQLLDFAALLLASDSKIVQPLEIEPEFGSRAQDTTDAEGGLRGDVSAAVNDLTDAALRNAGRLGQLVLA